MRIIWLTLNLALGLVPSLAFFAWVERGCALPWIGLRLGWPWIVIDAPLAVLVTWDSGLILLFGLIHSLFAQPFVHDWLSRHFPVLTPATLRSLYMAITGVTVTLVMGLWQSTGVILWAAPVRQQIAYAVSLMLFWGLLSVSFLLVRQLDLLHFIGLRQLMSPVKDSRSSGTPHLIRSGIYRHVRHPIYFFTLLAFVAAPVMPLDRMLVFLSSALYLLAALPLEERKLIATFGPAYEEYRQTVPALIPFTKRVARLPGARDTD